MAQLAVQTSSAPTRKLLTGAGVGPLVTAAYVEIMSVYAPDLAGPGVAALVGALAAILAGYFVRDKVNVPDVE